MPEYAERRISGMVEKYAGNISARHYTDDSTTPAGHCPLGRMAIEAGISPPPRRHYTHSIGMRGALRFARELQQEYGLPLDLLKQLQSASDDARHSQELIEKITRLLMEWKESKHFAA